MWQILICGALILTLSMGVRHGFGLWLLPMTQAQSWGREDFAFAMAIQNIAWGVGGIFSGMLSDRFGAFRVILFCALLYILGLFGMAYSSSPEQLTASAGLIIGLAQAGTTYAVIYGLIGRNISPDNRSWAMGFAAAAGSFGQFLMVPVEGWLINHFGWQQALVTLACLATLVIPLAFGLREKQFENGTPLRRQQSILQALHEAFSYRSFQLLTLGYFVCGFQVVFIGVHMPSYLKDQGLEPHVASTSLALIGLFNIFGTYCSGLLGQTIPKNKILSFIYFSRAIVIFWFISVPLSPLTVYIFSAFMGVLWLSTVPPTNAVVASIFGISHMAMLSGFVFLSHQLGSFSGVWLGGYLFDLTESYTIVWQICIALGIFSGLVNLPVKESPIQRLATA
ncbi:MAG: MFS transporter [Betaproteobacteria bacterium]|nr:MFS transporter [Betaproteobacteria bacterium]NBT66222.1 MFS transporter [Betaproteobacteria bacterium]NBY09058.1 MFS transporter [Betaproteobacteria bacterium]